MKGDRKDELLIGQTIRFFRTKKGITQKELAEKCGIAQATICSYENGNRIPCFYNMISIAKVLGFSLDIFKKI